jgi:hypothetical protein
MSKLWIFGDSHIGTMEFGMNHVPNWLAARPSFPIEFYGAHGTNWVEFETMEVDGGFRFFSDRVPDVARAADFTITSLDDVYVFSSPLHGGMTYWDPVWKKFCPWECAAANPHLQALSTSAVERWIATQMKCRFAMLKLLNEHGYRLAVLEPPKPLARTPQMSGTPADVIIAADRIHRDFVLRWLNEHDIPAITVPEHTYRDGLTTNEYSHDNPQDMHHGSLQFAKEMLEKH